MSTTVEQRIAEIKARAEAAGHDTTKANRVPPKRTTATAPGMLFDLDNDNDDESTTLALAPEPEDVEPEPQPRKPAAATVRELKDAGEDFEWYPTTDEIIRKVSNDLASSDFHGYAYDFKSVLDIGAGDGRVLEAIAKRHSESSISHRGPLNLYAIEKAITHLSNMPKRITVIGTDFLEQSLLDKSASVIFCNPPYKEYDAWTRKILTESTAQVVYLVIPQRWRERDDLRQLTESKYCKVKTLGEFDFENADRQARAKVEVIRITGIPSSFEKVVEGILPELDLFTDDLEVPPEERHDEIAEGSENIVESLTAAYQAEMAKMVENYRAACSISQSVLKQLGIVKKTIVEGIKEAVTGMKNRYWKTLFENMKTVTQRLATKQRKAFLSSIQSKQTIDFTAGNVYAFLIWVSKWANDYFDEQLTDLFCTLSADSNVVKYKSNQRVWTQGDWYYQKDSDRNKASHYRLEYRIVISHGGIATSEWQHERTRYHGLEERAFDLLRDIVTVANNLGFECDDTPANYEWQSNKQNQLKLKNGQTLVAVRAFKNGNLHLHFNPSVMLAINVEAGRLLGWIRNPQQAAEEFNATPKEAKRIAKLFGSSFRLAKDAGLSIELKE